jgi:hypothetical protein
MVQLDLKDLLEFKVQQEVQLDHKEIKVLLDLQDL